MIVGRRADRDATGATPKLVKHAWDTAPEHAPPAGAEQEAEAEPAQAGVAATVMRITGRMAVPGIQRTRST